MYSRRGEKVVDISQKIADDIKMTQRKQIFQDISNFHKNPTIYEF